MNQELGNSVLKLEFMLWRAVVRDETEETENGIIVKKILNHYWWDYKLKQFSDVFLKVLSM